jgi:D-glycero-alpha-D-manno-heptose 1-phosphate guanylyltransferase
MNAIILCGGLSTRLGEITKETPKILLEIGGKSVLDWQLEKLTSLGIKEVVLAAGHLAHVLHEAVGTERHGIDLVYAIEDKKLGTGGAIKHAMEYIADPSASTFVLNGDILYTIDFADMARSHDPNSDGIMLGVRVEDASTYGTLEYDDAKHLVAFKEKEGIEKPGYINGGLYLFSIEYDVFPRVKNMYVYTSDSPWVDVGVPERLDWARTHWDSFVV